jgi:hypothetical protein
MVYIGRPKYSACNKYSLSALFRRFPEVKKVFSLFSFGCLQIRKVHIQNQKMKFKHIF